MSARAGGGGKIALPALTLRQRWELRWPRLTVLRLEGVLAWLLIGSGVSWILAPWFVGNSTQQIGSAYDYMAIWVILSLGVACYWVYLQWRDRPSLPPQKPTGLTWSVAVNFMVVVAFFGVVPTAGQAAEHHIRSLRSRAELLDDLSSLRARSDCASSGRSISRWGRGSESWWNVGTGRSNNGTRDDLYVSVPRVSIDSYFLPPELQTPEECLIPEDLLHRYLTNASIQATLACVDGELNNLSESSTCRDAYSSPHDDHEALENDLRGCAYDVLRSCHRPALTSTWYENFSSLLLAHKIEFRHSTSTDPLYLLQLAVLAMVLATIAGCAGVFPARLAAATFLVLALLGFLVPAVMITLATNVENAGRIARLVGVLAYAAMLVMTGVSALVRRERSVLLDLGILLVCVGPLFVLVVEARTNMTEFSTCPATECKGALWPFPHLYPYGVMAWTALIGSALSWYRTLPHSR